MNPVVSMANQGGTAGNEPAPVLSYKQLLTVLGGLLVLTGITILASHFKLGALSVWLALFIASTKASLVLLFFMHLKGEGRAVAVTFLITIALVAVTIGFMFWDVAYRPGTGG
jgi:cytochrome c oxidase subunit 4